jgi:hypothetical protein
MSKYPLDNILGVGYSSYNITGTALYAPRLLQSLLSSGNKKKLMNFSVSGLLMTPIDELFQYLQSRGGKLVVEQYNGDYVFAWDDYSYISIDFRKKSNDIYISGAFLDPRLATLAADLQSKFVSSVKTNLIFSIVQTSSGLTTRSLGNGSSPLIKDNYNPEVLQEIEFVISSFSKTPPNGRIAILNGEPGTGKTHLIRSILARMDCVFLIVPSNLLGSLDKPEFIPLLLQVKSDYDKPVIMIIEDGDTCLVPRKGDNISTITSLLNLSDGILGSMIDIKMIISTNAAINEMDEAIMRPGRLCRNIHVGPLPYDRANLVYQRLQTDPEAKLEYRKFYTLAEIYDKHANIDTIPTNNTIPQYGANKRVLGFNIERPKEDQMVNKR